MKADINEQIYIEIPEKYQKFPRAVGLLNKTIYGLVQAGRCGNNKFCNDMTAIGFEQSKADPCVFRKIADKEVNIVVVVHVDDILAHAKDQATMERFTAELGRKFKLKDMCDVKNYMRCHISRNRKSHELKLDQHLYVKSMVEKFGVKKASRVPASSGVPTLSKAGEPQTLEENKTMLNFPYREAVGALMWVPTMTRPDIVSAVHAVVRFYENPVLAHKRRCWRLCNICSTRRNGRSCTVGRVVESTWRRTRTRILGLAWILDARYLVRQ